MNRTYSSLILPPIIQEKRLPTIADTSFKKKESNYGKWFSHLVTGKEKTIKVNTDLYTAELSTRGGGITRFTLKKFFTWNKNPVQLIEWNNKPDCNLFFSTSDGKLIDTKELYFIGDPIKNNDSISLKDSSKYILKFILPVVRDSVTITKTYVIHSGSYKIDCTIEMKNMAGIISDYEYQISIYSPPLSEYNSVDESVYSNAFAMVGNDLNSLDAGNKDETAKQNYLGKTSWVSIRNKYFIRALFNDESDSFEGAYLEGHQSTLTNEGIKKTYSASARVRYTGNEIEKKDFSLFYGPIEYDIIKTVHPGLEKVMDLGWNWLVRPISEYFMLPLFKILHSIIPNYGVVIIVFSIIIKIILIPLTKSSMNSMRKMQALQPMITELREKHKDDQQKQNAEMMKLYREYGINPMGGCLPLLLQMPILYALFKIFGSSIQLRQASFMLWINDLSVPDTILHLPFKIPLFSINEISGLAFLMGITMFIQQKQSVKDPRQKSMVYIMPVLFTLMFNGFPSGLNLYYFMFNILSIAQQYYLTKMTKDLPLQKVKRKAKKHSWIERSLEAVQKRSSQQKRK